MKTNQILKNLKWKLFYFDYDLTTEVFRGDSRLGKSYKVHSFARSLYRNNIQFVRRDPQKDILIFKTPKGIMVGTDNYWGIFSEIFISKIYKLDDQFIQQPFALFDLGMNRGYASLFFSTYDNCKIIYGYEPEPSTFQFAKFNCDLNADFLMKKGIEIKMFNYGLGNKNCTIPFLTISGRDGVGTCEGAYNSALKNGDAGKSKVIEVQIKNVVEEFRQRFEEINNRNLRKILKIDVEGAEYDIFDALCDSKVINQFDVIIGDSHNGLESIEKQLCESGFILYHHGYGVGECREFTFIKG